MLDRGIAREGSRLPVTTAAVLWIGIGAGTLFGTAFLHGRYEVSDFRLFYQRALDWRLGLPPTPSPRVNLNPPWLDVLMAPLTLAPEQAAFWIWTAISAALTGDALRRLRRSGRVAPAQWTWAAAATIAAVPCQMAWLWGELTWPLMYVVTRAWLSASPLIAGAWLAPAIVMKPYLALMALFLPRRVWMSAGAIAASLTLAGVVVLGVKPWADWLALSDTIYWIGWPTNASLWGVAARWINGRLMGVTIGQVSIAWRVAIAIGGGALLFRSVRSHGDRRWVVGLLWTTIVAPLGQVYYLPLILGPLAATWPTSLGTRAALVLFSVPIVVLFPIWDAGIATPWLGSIYAIATIWLTIEWTKHST